MIDSIFGSIKNGLSIDKLLKNGNRSIIDTTLNEVIKSFKRNSEIDLGTVFIDTFDTMSSGAKLSKREIDLLVNSLEDFKKQGILASATADDIVASLSNMGANNALKTLGATLKSFALNLAATAGFTLLFTGIDMLIGKLVELSQKQQEIAEQGKEAAQSVKDLSSAYQQNADWVSQNADRFYELSKGVSNGVNRSLTTAEFDEFHQLGNQIASMFPELVSGYDSLGNAIINTSNAQGNLNSALKEQRLDNYQKTLLELEDIMKAYDQTLETQTDGGPTPTGAKQALMDQIIDPVTNDLKQNLENAESLGKVLDQMDPGAVSDFLEKTGIEAERKRIAVGSGTNALTQAWIVNEKTLEENKDRINAYFESTEKEAEQNAELVRAAIPNILGGNGVYNELDEAGQNMISSLFNSFNADTIQKAMEKFDSNPDDWVKSILGGVDVNALQSQLDALSNLDPSKINKNNIDSYDKMFDQLQQTLHLSEEDMEEFKISFGINEESLNASLNGAKEQIAKALAGDENKFDSLANKDEIQNWLNTLSQSDLELIATMDISNVTSLDDVKEKIDQLQEDSRITVDIEANTTKIQNLQTAINEATSATGLSQTSMNNLIDMYGDDAYKAFEASANGVRLNTEALNALQSQQEALTKIKYQEDIQDTATALDKQKAILAELGVSYEDVSKGINSAKLSEEQWASAVNAASNISSLENELRNAKLLAAQYDGLTSSYNKWVQAQSTTNSGAIYDSITSGIEQTEELYKKGLVGTDDFKSFVQMISFEDLSTASMDTIVDKYEKNIGRLKQYFTEGADGAKRFLDEFGKFNEETDTWSFDFNDEELAKKLDWDVSTVQAMVEKFRDYGFNIQLDTSYSQENLNALQVKAEEAKQALAEMNNVDINVDYDVNDMSLEELLAKQKELEEAKIEVGADSAAAEHLNTMLDEVNMKIEEIKAKEKIGIDVDFNVDDLTLNELTQKKQELEAQKPKLGADSTELKILEQVLDQINQKIEALNKNNVSPNVSTAQLQQGYDLVSQLQNKLQEVNNASANPSVDIQNVASTNAEIDTLAQQLEDLGKKNPEILVSMGIEGTSAEEIKAQLETTPIEIPVNFQKGQDNSGSGDLSNDSVTKTVNVQVNGQEQLNSLINLMNEVKSIGSATVTASVEVNDSELVAVKMSLAQFIANPTYSATVTVIVDKANYDLFVQSLNMFGMMQVPKPKCDVDISDGMAHVNELKSAINSVQGKTVYMGVSIGTSLSVIRQLKDAIDSVKGKTVTITTKHVSTGDGEANGTAHASGTVYAKGSAYATGDWSLDKDETALVGELGQEIVNFFAIVHSDMYEK